MPLLLQFPGQLSEHIGMARFAREARPETERILDAAEAATGMPIRRLVDEGPEAELRQDRAAAVAMVTVNHMTLEALCGPGAAPGVSGVAGHSVGFDSALVAAGVLELASALEVVLAVDDAIEEVLRREGIVGGMGVVVGLAERDVDAMAARAGCSVACVNAATQVAVTGTRSAVVVLLEDARGAGALAVHLMPMRKPMHGPLLQPALPEIRRRIAGVPLREPKVPVVSHLDGSRLRTAEEIREVLVTQVGRVVRWRDAVATLRQLAPPSAMMVECGPGDVLTRLARWIDRGIVARTAAGAASELPVEAPRG